MLYKNCFMNFSYKNDDFTSFKNMFKFPATFSSSKHLGKFKN